MSDNLRFIETTYFEAAFLGFNPGLDSRFPVSMKGVSVTGRCSCVFIWSAKPITFFPQTVHSLILAKLKVKLNKKK